MKTILKPFSFSPNVIRQHANTSTPRVSYLGKRLLGSLCTCKNRGQGGDIHECVLCAIIYTIDGQIIVIEITHITP